MIERSNDLFKPKIIDYVFSPFVDDGILEPGEEVFFQNFTISNFGGISIPEGTILIVSTKGFSIDGFIVLPKIEPRNFILIG